MGQHSIVSNPIINHQLPSTLQSIQDYFQHLILSLTPIYGAGEAKSIARIVFEDAFHLFDGTAQRPFLFQDTFQTIQQRLLKQEPVQYILGQADFYGLKFKVSPDVLIPRSETEELVHWILTSNQLTVPSILDIGTGSGCIPISLKKKLPTATITAIDISPAALEIATENAQLNDVSIEYLQLDILKKSNWPLLPKYDIIISNPPYIPHQEAHLMPEWVKNHEPALALFVENEDPLIFYRTITNFAILHVQKNGYLFFETNEFNAKEVQSLMIANNWKEVTIEKDLFGKDRMIRGRLAN